MGNLGTTVDRATYGQYDRCSFSTSNCLSFVDGRDGELPSCGRAVADRDVNAHRPTRRWHNEQCRRDVSRALCPKSLNRGVRARIGVLPRCEILVRGEEGIGDGESPLPH